MKNNSQEAPMCSIDYAFQRLGGKYKGRLLIHLNTGTKRYGELRRSIVGINHKMLTQTLRELEEDGLIVRREYAELPPRVEYTLTPEGEAFVPFIDRANQWAKRLMTGKGIPMIMSSDEASYCLTEESISSIGSEFASKEFNGR